MMLNNAIILEGERVRLEPLSLSQANELFESGNFEEIWRVTTSKIKTQEDMETYIETALANKEKGTDYPFTVYDKQLQRYVGSTRYCNIALDHRSLEIGWTWYTPEVWRTRVNTECKYLLLKYGFEELGLVRIQFKTDSRNEHSQNAIQRIGATLEGVLRNERILPDGYIRNTNVYSIIDPEWQNVKSKLESILNMRTSS